jgi:hypothetical protein
VYAVTTDAANANAALQVDSGGKGAAILAKTNSLGTVPTVQATSANVHPALKGIGQTVPVTAAVPIAGNGPALSVQGVASFTRSGLATLAAAATSILVSVPGGLTATSHVLATLQTNTGNVAVRAAVPNVANGKVTIFFTGSVPVGTKVAWFVFG